MKRALKETILKLLDEHRVMTIATARPDGWPQATIVNFVNDGLASYIFIARDSQKAKNIARDNRVSATIGSDARRPLDIRGLSLGGTAVIVDDRAEIAHARTLFLKRHPELRVLPDPNPAEVAMVRIVPEVVSVVDYSKGFGHADLVTLSDSDLDEIVDSRRHHWVGSERR